MIVGMDKFNDDYIKIIGDFNESELLINFDCARVQKIEDGYYFLLAHVTSISDLSIFRYKPDRKRFPELTAILIKSKDYSMNLKDSEGKYNKWVAEPSLLDSFLINIFESPVNEYLKDDYFFKGYLNLQGAMFKEMTDGLSFDQVNALSFFKATQVEKTIDLPDCPLKQPSKSGGNGNYSNSKALEPLKEETALEVYEEAVKASSKAFNELSLKMAAELDVQDLHNLRLGIYIEMLRRRQN